MNSVKVDKRPAPTKLDQCRAKGKAGHGKGNWGKLGSEQAGALSIDVNDPNFDEDALIPRGQIALVETVYSITPVEMEEFLSPTIREFFHHGDVDELTKPLSEIGTRKLNPHIISLLIGEGCHRDNPERELVSKLLLRFATVAGDWRATAEDLRRGFDLALDNLGDLALDTPDADVIVAKFLARAIADEIVAPSYALGFDLAAAAPGLLRMAMKKAVGLIKTPQGLARLQFVWGVSGARSSVSELRGQVDLLLREYLDVGSVTEAERCIRDLRASFFHHEIVSQILRLAIDRGDMKATQHLASLLQATSGSSLISERQFTMGFMRVVDDLDDIAIDTPMAQEHMESFCRLAAPFLPKSLQEYVHLEAQKEGRKRTISVNAAMPPMQQPLRR